MENILSLPDEVFISFLGFLPLPELIHFLESNKEIRERLFPYFEKAIESQREIYYYPPSSCQSYQKKIEREIETMVHFIHHQEGYNRLYLLDPQLTRDMNLGHIPSYQNMAIYTPKLLQEWWELYAYSNRLFSQGRIRVDDWMSSVLSLPLNQSLSLREFSSHLRTKMRGPFPLTPSINIIYALFREEQELNEYLNYARFINQ